MLPPCPPLYLYRPLPNSSLPPRSSTPHISLLLPSLAVTLLLLPYLTPPPLRLLPYLTPPPLRLLPYLTLPLPNPYSPCSNGTRGVGDGEGKSEVGEEAEGRRSE